MTKKAYTIYMEEDDISGSLYDQTGEYIGCLSKLPPNLKRLKKTKSSSNIEDFIKLKNAGFTADEIVKLTKG